MKISNAQLASSFPDSLSPSSSAARKASDKQASLNTPLNLAHISLVVLKKSAAD
jgi:hypothetical protein